MTVNRFRPHVMVMPEDGANRQIANGFWQEVAHVRSMQVLPEYRGWSNVLDIFQSDLVGPMRTDWPHKHVVILLDFDGQEGRPAAVAARIPEDVRPRVFVLGAMTTPEALKAATSRSFEQIGQDLAAECRDGRRELWDHPLLSWNCAEVTRLEQAVRAILF